VCGEQFIHTPTKIVVIAAGPEEIGVSDLG
jgi:hypothetical protein